MNLAGEIKQAYRKGDILFRLIYINIALFVLIGLGFVFYRLFTPGITLTELRIFYSDHVVKYLMVPSRPDESAFPSLDADHLYVHAFQLHAYFVQYADPVLVWQDISAILDRSPAIDDLPDWRLGRCVPVSYLPEQLSRPATPAWHLHAGCLGSHHGHRNRHFGICP